MELLFTTQQKDSPFLDLNYYNNDQARRSTLELKWHCWNTSFVQCDSTTQVDRSACTKQPRYAPPGCLYPGRWLPWLRKCAQRTQVCLKLMIIRVNLQFLYRRPNQYKRKLSEWLYNIVYIHTKSMFSSIIMYKQLKSVSQCNNNILVNNNNYNYCQKAQQLNQIILNNKLSMTQSAQIYIYTSSTKDSSIKADISNVNINCFTLFNFNKNISVIMNSVLNISLQFEVIKGALLCIQCDIQIQNSTLIFIASGQQLSGLILNSQESIILSFCSIQNKFTSIKSSNIVNVVNTELLNFSIVQSQILGFNFKSGDNGYIAAQVEINIQFSLEQVEVCVLNTPQIGILNTNIVINQSGHDDLSCINICGDQIVAYGLCVDQFVFSKLQNEIYQCQYPFEYNYDSCVCTDGYLLNNSLCINILSELNSISVVKDNITTLQKIVFDNITAINQSIIQGNNIIFKQIQDTSDILDQLIFQNVSTINTLISNTTTQLTKNILENSSNLDNRILENISNVNAIISSVNSTLLKQMADNSTILDSRIFNNITDVKQTITDNVTTLISLIQKLQGQIDLLQDKQDKLPIEILDNMFQQDSYEATELWMICGQPTFVQTFDITSITNTIIATNFTNGSVFGSLINVQNAFIDIQNNVYSSVVEPLFDAQNQFYNIKVQVGTQIVGNGQILSSNNAIIINQLIIMSKIGTMITINSLLQLNILQTQSVNINVKDLKVNLDVEASTGNLSLIGQMTGQLSIINYEVAGIYKTQGSMSLGVNTASLSKIVIKQVNFAPSSYIYGNQSSYFFNSVNNCNIEFSRSKITLINQIFSSLTSSSSNQQQFGGLISNINSTRLIVAEISYTSNFTCTTQYVMNSGFLLGKSNSTLSQIVFQWLCFSTTLKATSNINQFGIIGFLDGNVTIKQSNILMNITSDTMNNCGVIGQLSVQSLQSVFQDIYLVVNIQCFAGSASSAMIGQLFSSFTFVSNISFVSSVYNGTGIYGGLVAYSNSNISLQNCMFDNIIITSNGYSAVVIGQSTSQVQLINIKVNNTLINSTSFVGGCIAYSSFVTSLLNGVINNSSLFSKMNLGGFFGVVTYQMNLQNVNVTELHIISLMNYSAGGIIGSLNANITIQFSYVYNTNVSFGAGSAGIIGISTQNIVIIDVSVYMSIINGTNGTGGVVGLLGKSISASFTKCSITNTKLHSNDTVGSISGFLNQSCTIKSSQTDNNTIISVMYAGGIIGYSIDILNIENTTVKNCNISSSTSVAGGIIGMSNIVIMKQCSVDYITLVAGGQTGGIIGVTINVTTGFLQIDQVDVNNINQYCINGNSLGAVIGIIYLSSVISNVNVNNATLNSSAAYGVGGIIGIQYANVQIIGCVVKYVNIFNGGNGAAGFIGYSNYTVSIANCQIFNSVFVSAGGSGGIIGYQKSNISNQTQIQNTTVRNVSLTAYYAGGFIGNYDSTFVFIIKNSRVSKISASGSGQAGIVIGNSPPNYLIISSGSDDMNAANGIIIQYCSNFTTVKGC
ncbi:Conserved_hypothetical protein [Hexamita inflata]|uniref:Uncharacterized protein n=1 Tax=Hexamita inflata TaxID=28002 RepID=A0ABP1GGT1_9EUKA